MELGLPINKDVHGMSASSSNAFSIERLIETNSNSYQTGFNKDSDGMLASSSKTCSIEFLIENKNDSNGIGASNQGFEWNVGILYLIRFSLDVH
jgi:hypothetical protein